MSVNCKKPDFVFEVSWDICNTNGNISQAISAKASKLKSIFGENYICIGPDIFKGNIKNNNFIEDESMFLPWRQKAKNDNLPVRIGKWNVPGQPVAILADYTALLSDKDNIFSELWSKHQLDSLSGRWDYIEPAMFGYAAGQVIEHFFDFYMSSNNRFIAHFHNWQAGAGILHLTGKLPQAGTVFTIHNTVIGKAMSDSGVAPEKGLENANIKEKAGELNVVSKNSLENIAVKNTDIITTISESLSKECKIIHSKQADIITPDKSDELSLDELAENYQKAYELSIKKVNGRASIFKDKKPQYTTAEPTGLQAEVKKELTGTGKIPHKLKELKKLSKNIWWSWNYEAAELFETIDPDLWERTEKTPVRLLDILTDEHYNKLLKNDSFMKLYHKVTEKFNNYIKEGSNKQGKQIAYFSMEYGLHESIKIYSGGLGVLAGDYLKQASDDNMNMIGVGLLYRYGYFTQNISGKGEQLSKYYPHNFSHMSAIPVNSETGEPVVIDIELPGRTLKAKIWKIDVGRIPLYLMDADLPENKTYDRIITHRLYGGDKENRLKQEILLGIGGIKLLDAIGLKPDIYHCNEGHAAFIGLERLRKYIEEEKLTYNEAKEVVKASDLFTTHTPVPAGHDFFAEEMLREYMHPYADKLNIEWETLMDLGRMKPGNKEEEFSMSVLAANLSQEINGVSKLHGEVSREMFSGLYPGYQPEELHLGYVTNGVHYPTWTSEEWQKLYDKYFGKDFSKNCSNKQYWEKVHDVPDDIIWEKRNHHRKLLINYIRRRVNSKAEQENESVKNIKDIIDKIDDNMLTIGFARRFATYKRANLLFNDPERLSRIVNIKNKPILFIYAGKAHPADKAGQDFINKIVEYSNKEEFKGKILFIEDYDMELARYLVQGVDIWLNTPTRPMEASGTSGQKATLNGVLNFSVLDGWWAEGYRPKAGWALKKENTYQDKDKQNKLDAETIYEILEKEVIPLFYNRNEKQIPEEWISWVKNNLAEIAPHYTNKRMLDDYINNFYKSNFDSTAKLTENNYAKAKELANWKTRISKTWEDIEVKEIKAPDNQNISLSDKYFVAEVTIDLKGLSPKDVGVEALFFEGSEEETVKALEVFKMKQDSFENNTVTFKLDVPVKGRGFTKYKFRMFPKHELLVHKQNFKLTKWLKTK